jgi:hypothetical protein
MADEFSLPLQPLRERKIEFRGREIQTVDLPDNQGYVSLNSLCDAFGLDRKGQRQRLARQGNYFDPYLATISVSTGGGPQPTLCLMAAAVPLFLTGVQVERVADPESRALLRAFLDEALEVLAEHFGLSERGELQFLRDAVGRMVAEQESFDQRIENLSKKVEAELAEIRRAHEEKVQQIREAFGALRGEVRHVVGPKERITPEQLGQLRETVNTLGVLMQERGVVNPYAGIYTTLFRMTGIARSEHISQEDFPRVLAFLDQQIQALRDAAEQEAAEKQAASGGPPASA